MDYTKAQNFWKEKDAQSVKADAAAVRRKMEEYILTNNTCALATGAGDFIRNTPIEYSYHDGCFWMFSEGGDKFIGLEKNPNVLHCNFDKYTGHKSLKGLQVMGTASIVEPFSEAYNVHAAVKKKMLDALRRLDPPMNLIKVELVRAGLSRLDFTGRTAAAARQQYVFQ